MINYYYYFCRPLNMYRLTQYLLYKDFFAQLLCHMGAHCKTLFVS